MIKKLLLSTALFASVSMISAQQMTNLVFDDVIAPTGKITLADGTETGFNNTGNLVTVSSTASTADFSSKDSVVVFPNPVADMLNNFLKTVDNRSFKFLKK